MCNDLGGGVWRGSFALSITPPGAAFRMVVWDIAWKWKCRRPAEYQCFLRQPRLLTTPGDPFQGHMTPLALHSIRTPGDCSPQGLGKGKSWLEHTGQRAAVEHSHCLDVKELGVPPSLPLSWSWGPWTGPKAMISNLSEPGREKDGVLIQPAPEDRWSSGPVPSPQELYPDRQCEQPTPEVSLARPWGPIKLQGTVLEPSCS